MFFRGDLLRLFLKPIKYFLTTSMAAFNSLQERDPRPSLEKNWIGILYYT